MKEIFGKVKSIKNIIMAVAIISAVIILAFFVNAIGIFFPIIITILGIIYILISSPTLILGPLGLFDKTFAILLIIASWIFYFITPLIVYFVYLVIALSVIALLTYLVMMLYKILSKKKRK